MATARLQILNDSGEPIATKTLRTGTQKEMEDFFAATPPYVLPTETLRDKLNTLVGTLSDADRAKLNALRDKVATNKDPSDAELEGLVDLVEKVKA